MKQDKRKVGLCLVGIALGVGSVSLVGAAGSPESDASLSENVDSAIADIEKVLGNDVATAPVVTEATTPDAESAPALDAAPLAAPQEPAGSRTRSGCQRYSSSHPESKF